MADRGERLVDWTTTKLYRRHWKRCSYALSGLALTVIEAKTRASIRGLRGFLP